MPKQYIKIFAIILFIHMGIPVLADSTKLNFPDGFVDIKEVIPSIVLDIRYYTSYNFVGEKIDGYESGKCIITRKAADALKKVQDELSGYSLSLKLYDCYRPQRAVDHFVRWAGDKNDFRMKKAFYPAVRKNNLFKHGYLAARSGHSRGSSIDLTIVPIPVPIKKENTIEQDYCECCTEVEKRYIDFSIDMGTGFDCFDKKSWTAARSISQKQRENRQLLKTVMEKYGFRNYRKEWWHFTLKNEPYPDTYFNFIVR